MVKPWFHCAALFHVSDKAIHTHGGSRYASLLMISDADSELQRNVVDGKQLCEDLKWWHQVASKEQNTVHVI